MKRLVCGPRFWRWASPSSLLLAALLFPLPWIEICCASDPPKIGAFVPATPAAPPTGTISEIKAAIDGLWASLFHRSVFVSQTGLQAIHGGYSSPEFHDALPGLDGAIDAAPLTLAYALILLVGIGIGFFDGAEPRKRMQIVGTCGAAACVVLWAQTLIGFPLILLFHREMERATELERSQEFVRFTLWYWLSHLAVLGSVVLVGWEWRLTRRRSAFPKPNRCGTCDATPQPE